MKRKLYVGLAIAWVCLMAGAQVITGDNTVRAEYLINSFVDATPIGSHNPSTGVFTNLTASAIFGPLTGNVIGNVTGNSSTASALAAVPSNCSAGISSYGIQTNGNALCNSSTAKTVGLQLTSSNVSGGTFCSTTNT